MSQKSGKITSSKEVDIIKRIDLTMDEQKKYDVIKRLVEENGNKDRAAMTLGLTRRQVNRLILAYRENGKEAFVHGNRGRRPAKAIPDKTKKDILNLYRLKYTDANFTHFTELLAQREGISLSVSCVSSILEDAGILSPRVTKAKKKRILQMLKQQQAAARTKKEAQRIQENLIAAQDAHSRRPRCAYFGELQQMDASPYAWFGNTKTTLHIAVDDATGMITGAYFDQQETLDGYYHVYAQILNHYGIPYKFFTDRRTVFTYKKKNAPDIGEDTYTQFAYACRQLGTALEFSSVPQAKGRVERMFETLQSRLPVEMRLAGVDCLKAANEFLDSYIDEFNARFALPPHHIRSVFEAQPSKEKINLTLAVLTQRTVDSGHCIQFEKRFYRMLDGRGLQVHYRRGTKAMVIRSLDRTLFCCVNDKDIYALEEVPEKADSSQDLDPGYTKPEPRKTYIPPMEHPWRSRAFWKFVKMQEHHLMDDVPA